NYLEEKYPDLSFKVGFAKVDIIYSKYYASAACMNDSTSFCIAKGFGEKAVNEDYLENKNRILYNLRIQSLFKGSDIEGYLISATGTGEKSMEACDEFMQVNIRLSNDAEHIAVVRKALSILAENKIIAEKVIFTYEKGNGVYELWVSPDEYNSTENELEKKERRIK
ncbi:MAG TPA: hypothetical protein PLI20_10520, partial [Bacillota bacterium]|nr:hypothetical protein [Bacillota bacterium]